MTRVFMGARASLLASFGPLLWYFLLGLLGSGIDMLVVIAAGTAFVVFIPLGLAIGTRRKFSIWLLLSIGVAWALTIAVVLDLPSLDLDRWRYYGAAAVAGVAWSIAFSVVAGRLTNRSSGQSSTGSTAARASAVLDRRSAQNRQASSSIGESYMKLGVLAVLSILALTSCVRSPGEIAPGLTRESVGGLRMGMHLKDVKELLGQPVLEDTSLESQGIYYCWYATSGMKGFIGRLKPEGIEFIVHLYEDRLVNITASDGEVRCVCSENSCPEGWARPCTASLRP